MLLSLPKPKSKQAINQIQKIYAEQQLDWRERVRRSIYRTQMQLIKNDKNNSIEDIKQKKSKVWQKINIVIVNQKKPTIEDCQKEELPVFPHGYYAFYIPLMTSCKFPDQFNWFFSYLYQLEEHDFDDKRSLCCQQITSALAKAEQTFTQEPAHKKIQYFERVWGRCLTKFTCEFDSIKKIQIYLELLKNGTKALKDIYSRLKNKILCDFHVLQVAVLRCERYFRPEVGTINKNLQQFSMYQGEQINESTLACTMKMLFCPLCNIYDCGKHEDDLAVYDHKHQYISPNNMISLTQSTNSALRLLNQQMLILSNKVEACQYPCSQRCYKLLKTKQDYIQLQKKKANYHFSLVTKGIINLGISCFAFDPCLIWSLIQNGKNPNFKITCELVFLYFIYDYQVLKKIPLKLSNDEESHLKLQKNCEEINPKLYTSNKKLKPQMHYKSNLSVCHHYYLGFKSFDEGCNNCICSQRGFCRIQCMCSSECRLKKGCKCDSSSKCSTNKCVCFQNSRQCQPGICGKCFHYDGITKSNHCKNNAIIENDLCLVRVGKSKLSGAGLGLFAGQDIKAKQLVYTYTGQIINLNAECLRESTRNSNDFYNFACNKETVDSRYFGNLARFINHGNEGEDNLMSEIKMSNGVYVIVFFAKKDIAIGDELYFNYDGQGELFRNHKTKYPFIKKSKNK